MFVVGGELAWMEGLSFWDVSALFCCMLMVDAWDGAIEGGKLVSDAGGV